MNPTAFDQFEELEEHHWWFRGRRTVYLDLLRSVLGGQRPERVLDIGAGVGGFLQALETVGDEVHYTELCKRAINRCSERSSARGLQADALHLPYAEMSFDLVCLFDVLEHIEDHEGALREVARVLNPGGVAILSVPAHPWMWSENDSIAEHMRRYTRRGLLEVIDWAQLSVERCTFANAALFPAIVGYVLAGKAARLLRITRGNATNLSLSLPHSLDQLCYRVFAAESGLMRHLDLPLGHSLCAVVRRRDVLMTPILKRDTKSTPSVVAVGTS
jgi:SAM-dependent methyltransferase